MLLPNCLFRMGGAAILLSNRKSDQRRAKYRLVHVVRTHKGADDKSFKCVQQQEDPEGKVGINLCIDLMQVAGEALKSNITTIGPLVLPASEQLLFVLTLICRKIFKKNSKPYIPDFKLAFEHFCIHAGGRYSSLLFNFDHKFKYTMFILFSIKFKYLKNSSKELLVTIIKDLKILKSL